MQTTLHRQDWMDHLLEFTTQNPVNRVNQSLPAALTRDLRSCFAYCDKITAFHSKSFYMASRFLPPAKRNAIRALYAFCRTTDDIVDMEQGANHGQIERWRKDTVSENIRFNDPVVIAWAHTRSQFNIPNLYASQLIDGVKMDLHKKRYESFAELTEYCYKVASTVGLMSMHIVGFKGKKAIPYAIKLGVALQLTNILRDIAEDYTRGRIYLPENEMNAFGINESHFMEKRNDPSWKAFMRYQIQRTRNIYLEAWPGLQLLHPDGRLSIAAAASFYRNILDRIEAHHYDVFNHRASVSRWGKMKRIPSLLIKYKYAGSLNTF